MDIFFNAGKYILVDSFGVTASNRKPRIACLESATWTVHIVDTDNAPLDLSEAVTWRAAIDSDYMQESEVMARTTNDDIDSSRAATGILEVKINGATTTFLQKINSKSSLNVGFELWGVNLDGKYIFHFDIPAIAVGVRDPLGGVTDPAQSLVDAEIVKAIVSAPPVIEYSEDGVSWHTSRTASDTLFRVKHGEDGAYSEAQTLQVSGGAVWEEEE